MSGLTILYRMTGNSQNFARIKLGIKLISDSVYGILSFTVFWTKYRYLGNAKLKEKAKVSYLLPYC